MPYLNKFAHKQCRILLPAEDYESLAALAQAEERSISYVASRFIREGLARKEKRPLTPLQPSTCPPPAGDQAAAR